MAVVHKKQTFARKKVYYLIKSKICVGTQQKN